MTLGALSAADISGTIVSPLNQQLENPCVVGTVDPATGDTIAYCPPIYTDQQLAALAAQGASASYAALPGLPAPAGTNWGMIGFIVAGLALLMAAKK